MGLSGFPNVKDEQLEREYCKCQSQNNNFFIKSFKKFDPYLTSADDGLNPDYTEELLAGLKEHGVCATFFLLGKEVENQQFRRDRKTCGG